MAKRKYTRSGETPKAYKCTNRKCGWEGTGDQRAKKPKGEWLHSVCPECSNDEFYGLLEKPLTS